MQIFDVIAVIVWYAIAGLILLVVALMLARVILNKADLNPFSTPVILVRRWTDPLVNPVRRPLVQMGFSPNIAPLVTILLAILFGYFASEFIGAALVTVRGLIMSAMLVRPISFVGFILYGVVAYLSLFIFVRIILSWFMSPMSRVLHFLIRVTEPVLAPFRRLLPPVGMLDISPIVVLFLLDLFKRAIAATLI